MTAAIATATITAVTSDGGPVAGSVAPAPTAVVEGGDVVGVGVVAVGDGGVVVGVVVVAPVVDVEAGTFTVRAVAAWGPGWEVPPGSVNDVTARTLSATG